MKKRIVGLDVFRVLSALIVFLFHSHMHMKSNYGFLNDFISMGAIFMTAFFMLSGFTLYQIYSDMDLTRLNNTKEFYIKRILSIAPLYYFVVLITFFILKDSFVDNLKLLPIQIFGLQTTFSSLFQFSHNGGTWFVSCLAICYFLFPFLQELLKQVKNSSKVGIIIFCCFILLYAPFVMHWFKTADFYSNPFFRTMEFLIGMALSSILKENKDHVNFSIINTWKIFFLEFAVLIFAVTIAVRMSISVGNYMLYNWIGLPVFIAMLITLFNIRSPFLENNKILRYLSGMSYAFFLGQFYTWLITDAILDFFSCQNNFISIMVSLLVCCIITVVLHEMIEKPVNRLGIKKLLSK